MKEKLWEIANIVRTFSDPDEALVDALHRVLIINSEFIDTNLSSDKLFKLMEDQTKHLKDFEGSSLEFHNIYNIISGLDRAGLFSLLEYALENLYKKKRIPLIAEAVSNVLFENIDQTTETVFIPDAERYGINLLKIVNKYPSITFYISANENIKEVIKLLLKEIENVEFIDGDYYSIDFTNLKFDFIASFPLIGVKDTEKREYFISDDSSLIAAQNLLYHLTMNGKLTIILPARVTFGATRDAKEFRSYIDSFYRIREISILPPNIFSPYTSLNTYLFTFSNGKTEEIHLRKFSKRSGVLYSDEMSSKLIFNYELEALNGWYVDSLFDEDDDDIIAYRESTVKKRHLSSVSTIFRGRSTPRKAKSGNINVINISDITELGIDYATLDTIKEEERKVSRYLLEDGDVLITTRGTNVKVAVFENQYKPCISSSNISVIRITDRNLNSTYLKLFLESQVGLKLLKQIQRGTSVLNINHADLQMIEVPIPPLDDQEKLVQTYYEGLSTYKEIVDAANQAWDKIQLDIYKELF